MAKVLVTYSTGRRKNAIARVYMKEGSGKIRVNNRDFDNYFFRATSRMVIHQPLEMIDRREHFDFNVKCNGGGLSGQAGAVRLGITRCLISYDPSLRPILKKAGYLTRDSRMVERKKYGQSGARKRYQFSKR